MKILLVDDMPENLIFINHILYGHMVFTAKNGVEALAMFDESFDLVISDIMMPEMDGYELCKKIREISDIPVIFASANTNVKDIKRAYMLGITDYIAKPINSEMLLHRVKISQRLKRKPAWLVKLTTIFNNIKRTWNM